MACVYMGGVCTVYVHGVCVHGVCMYMVCVCTCVCTRYVCVHGMSLPLPVTSQVSGPRASCLSLPLLSACFKGPQGLAIQLKEAAGDRLGV